MEARAAVEIWAGVAAMRQNYESVQVAKAFLALIRCEKALDHRDGALVAFRRAVDLLQVPLGINPKSLKPILSEMTDLVRPTESDAS